MTESLQPDLQSQVGDVVLAVSPIVADQRALRAILSEWPTPLVTACTIEETVLRLLRAPAAVILCERDLPDGGWKQLFQRTETLPRPPRFIVSSRLADEYLWVEVLNLGGQDVLQTPFVAREVRHAVRCAGDTWQRQWVPKAVRRMTVSAASPATDATAPCAWLGAQRGVA